jgi:hypothetical protein
MPKLSALTAKAAPTTADELIITDKADSNNTKRITINNLPLSAAEVSALATKAALAGADFTGDVTTTGNLGVGTSSPQDNMHIHDPNDQRVVLRMTSTTSGSGASDGLEIAQDGANAIITNEENGDIRFGTNNIERMRLDSSGNLLVGKTSAGFPGGAGIDVANTGILTSVIDGNVGLIINRLTNDGDLIDFYQAGTKEGSISVSGSTVSYNGGHLARWSRMLDGTKPENLLKGTVMTNLDEMIEWAYPETPEVLWAAGDGLPEGVSVGDVKVEGVDEVIDEEGNIVTEAVEEVLWAETDGLPEGVSIGDVKVEYKPAGVEDNEQLNHTAISSVEGDRDVAGVFIAWDDDDDYNDYNLAMVGDVIIRIAEGVEVKRGDLLISAGDGTAKPQDDDLIRSSTIAKVTSTHVTCVYDDGSFCVPCVLK